MSQDLLASFFEENPTQNNVQAHRAPLVADETSDNPWAVAASPVWEGPIPVQEATAANEDDDDFGDFEDASAPVPFSSNSQSSGSIVQSSKTSKLSHETIRSSPLPAPSNNIPIAASSASKVKDDRIGKHPFAGHMDLLFETGDDEYDAGADELGDLATNPEAAVAYSKRIIAAQEAALEKAQKIGQKNENVVKPSPATTASAKNATKNATATPSRNPNVLFDADDVSEDEDDDFGGFESGNESNTDPPNENALPRQAQQHSSMPAVDLLGLDDFPEAGHSVGSSREPIRNHGAAHPLEQRRRDNIDQEDDDGWDDFEAAAPTASPLRTTTKAVEPHTFPFQSTSSKTASSKDTPMPPVNVPPPAVLISLFPSIMAEADEALFNAISKLDLKQRQMLLGHPASHQFLKGYLEHCRVMARIVAGRKLRWKRDQRLSQSMRIGPPAAGGKGGMKLAGVDKTESTKEDREVLDMLGLWKNQVGKLRTAVTAASAAPSAPKLPPVPKIAEQMPIKSLKSAEGGFTAPHACALCGLKREERVAKVDVKIEDSFGEWWVQSMSMHLSCRTFWEEFEKKLKSR